MDEQTQANNESPETQSKRFFLIVGAVIGGMLLISLLTSIGGSDDGADVDSDSATANVEYVVRAERTSITYTSEGGNEQITEQRGSWRHRVNVQPPTVVSLVVQDRTGRDNAEITCEIRVGNSPPQSSTSHGAHAVARCSVMIGTD